MLSDEVEDWLRRRGGLLVAAGVLAVAVWQSWGWWLRPPAVEFDNLKYIQLLSTAVSARNPEWLEKVRSAVDTRHSAGELSDRELAAFERILATAQAGEWQRAERDCYDFAKAQLSRRRSQPPGDDHEHEHQPVRPGIAAK
jgi:predicted negative regulator of RcsB-dependent stress response